MPKKLLDAWLEGGFMLFVSPPIVTEIQRVLAYPRIRERLGPGQADQLISSLFAVTEWVEGKLILDVLTQDPSDNVYLACAVDAQADILVTGNLKHYVERFRG